MSWINITFLLLAGVFNGVMDTLVHHYDESIFNGLNKKFWDPRVSHLNKWRYNKLGRTEWFWGSSRWFVWVTDAWHLSKFLMIKCIFLAMLDYDNVTILDILALSAWYVGFWIVYENKLINYTLWKK